MKRKINAKKILIKIGTNALTNNGNLNFNILKSIVREIAELKKKGKQVIMVTSGAIGTGMKELNLKSKPNDVVMQQVCAAIGQSILMSTYNDLFKKYNIKTAQILLTYDVFTNREKYRNLKNSLSKLLNLGVIPILNENDPISISEIGPSFGDNDNLSALVATKVKMDLVILLTNVDGLYDINPKDKNAVLIKEVKTIDKRIEAAGGIAAALGLGGMKTKIEAAKTATKAGITVIVANGKKENVITNILNNEEEGTIFYPKT